ncbi:hypothetical protein EP7_005437 [Isosphaeraceae bacterium EP7]
MADATPGSKAGLRRVRIALAASLAVALVLATSIGPMWYQALVPTATQRAIHAGALRSVLVAHALVLLASSGAIGAAALASGRARRDGRRRPRWAVAALAAGVSGLMAVGLVEAGAAGYRAWIHRMPGLAMESAPGPDPATLTVLAVGESSALGEPYHPKISVAQMVAWKLGEVFPGRKVAVEFCAVGGMSLEGAHALLARVGRRPDVMVVCSGHNEFQARFSWERNTTYYLDDPLRPDPSRLADLARAISPLADVVLETVERQRVDVAPPPKATRTLIDVPCFTEPERASMVADFGRRLGAIAGACRRMGVVPVLVIPVGNDAGFDPSRSVLDSATPRGDRDRIAVEFQAIRDREADHPDEAIAGYRALLDRQPRFAEAHFRLARLAEARGDNVEARDRYHRARELDSMPMRCPDDFQDAYRVAAADNDSVVLIDSPKLFAGLSPRGLTSDHLLHDAQHPTLLGYMAQAQQVLDEMARRGSLNWPKGTPAPILDADACVAHFQIDRPAWTSVCGNVANFYRKIAYIRFDPRERLNLEQTWLKATAAIENGALPESLHLPGLGRRPTENPAADPRPVPPLPGPPIEANPASLTNEAGR